MAHDPSSSAQLRVLRFHSCPIDAATAKTFKNIKQLSMGAIITTTLHEKHVISILYEKITDPHFCKSYNLVPATLCRGTLCQGTLRHPTPDRRKVAQGFSFSRAAVE